MLSLVLRSITYYCQVGAHDTAQSGAGVGLIGSIPLALFPASPPSTPVYTPPPCLCLQVTLLHLSRNLGPSSLPQKVVSIYSYASTVTSPPSHHPHMKHQHHPPSKLPECIPLEEVPPLYCGRRAALGLNIMIVGRRHCRSRCHPYARTRRTPHHASRVGLRPQRRRRRPPGLPQCDATPTPLGAWSGARSRCRGTPGHSDRFPST